MATEAQMLELEEDATMDAIGAINILAPIMLRKTVKSPYPFIYCYQALSGIVGVIGGIIGKQLLLDALREIVRYVEARPDEELWGLTQPGRRLH